MKFSNQHSRIDSQRLQSSDEVLLLPEEARVMDDGLVVEEDVVVEGIIGSLVIGSLVISVVAWATRLKIYLIKIFFFVYKFCTN